MGSPIVFLDFAGPDDVVLREFYTSIFGWEIDPTGQFSVSAVSPIRASIRKDPAEKRVYVGVPDVSETLSQIKRAGGTIDAPRFEVVGVVILGLFRDPAGNPMGLVEMDGDVLRIP